MVLQLGCSLWWVSLLSTLFSHKVYRLLILKRVQRERSTRRRHQRGYHDEKTGLQSLIKNIESFLARGRGVQVEYLYQRSELAWVFVVAREVTEGRNIPCAEFVRRIFLRKRDFSTDEKVFWC